ncbi:MAG: hypothetical protein M1371_11275 [Actinobacteria bacterium]|nr:hypothetical protein [Actinomycetota bacterium]
MAQKVSRTLTIVLLIFGVIGLAIGTVFVVKGMTTNSLIAEKLRAEKITVGIPEELATNGNVVDSLSETQAAADVLNEHLKKIAPTYGDLLAGERFDPTNPAQLSYAQGINLENAFRIATVAFGVSQIAIVSGAFVIIMGIALILIGLNSQLQLSRASLAKS